MRAVVFAGPSLGGARPAPVPGVTLRPPAIAGDVYAAARDGAEVIGLVDGAFEDRATVWHKEILFALSQGVRVLGAASLGALRAVECAPFGMEGIGEIYARFRDGRLGDDAELALVFGPAEMSYPALSVPLVNIRATLERAEAEGVLTAAEAAEVLGHAQGIFFKELTWPRLLSDLSTSPAAETSERLGRWLPDGEVDLKRADALALIEVVARALEEPAPERPDFRFAETRAWLRAVEWFERDGARLTRTEEAVLDEMRLDPVRFERALTRAFARRAARESDAPAARTRGELIEDLRLRLDLPTAGAFRAWLAEVEAEPAALAQALDDEETLQTALEAAIPQLAPAVLDEARIDGKFETLAARAEAKRALTAHAPAPRYDETELRALLGDLCARRRISLETDDLDALARSLGLADRRALHRLLRAEETFAADARREKTA